MESIEAVQIVQNMKVVTEDKIAGVGI